MMKPHTNSILSCLTLGLVVLAAGCLPIELSVSKDGIVLIPRQEGFFTLDPKTKKVTQVLDAKAGAPAFGVFTPDGKKFIAATSQVDNEQQFDIALVEIATKQSKKLYSGSNITYLSVSPNGKHLALTRVSDQSDPKLEENLPELILIDMATGEQKKLAGNVGKLFRWIKGGEALAVFQIQDKRAEANLYVGTVAILDVASGKATEIAGAVSDDVFLDVAPNGRTMLITAKAAGATGKAPAFDENRAHDMPIKLFEIDVMGKTAKEIEPGISYAFYSADGKQVMRVDEEGRIGVAPSDNLFEWKLVAEDAALSVDGGAGNATNIYGGWLNNGTVLYIAERAAFGTAGKNLELATVSIDGATRSSYQATIDAAAVDE